MPTPTPNKMERLRDLASRSRRPATFPFPFPSSLSRRNVFEESVDDLAVQSLPSVPPPERIVGPASQIEATTQTDDSDDVTPLHDSDSMKKHVAERERRASERRDARAQRRDAERRLLAMADILAAHGDVVADSGSALSRRLNELARDILEAGEVIRRREREIADISRQIGAMERHFGHAHAALCRAQALVGDIIDGGLAQVHRHRTLATMEQALRGIRVVLGDGRVDEWERDKVDGILAKLDRIYKKNDSLYRYTAISQDVADLARRFRDVVFDARFNYLLAVDPDPSTTLQKFCEETRGSAEEEWKEPRPADYFRRGDPGRARKAVAKASVDARAAPPGPRRVVTMRYRDGGLTPVQQPGLLWEVSSPPALPAGTSTAATTAAAAAAPEPPRQTITTTAATATIAVPAGGDEDDGDDDAPCECLACRVSLWVTENPDQKPEVLRDAFVESMGGMESLHGALLEAMRRTGVQLMPSSSEVGERLDELFRCIATHHHTQ